MDAALRPGEETIRRRELEPVEVHGINRHERRKAFANGTRSSRHYPDPLRRIRFKDPETGKTLVFLTNNMALPALTICALYKERWGVELFFKWIKQHLRIKRFMGTSEYAVKTLIWCAVATYTLIAITKEELGIEASLYTLLQVFSVSVFEKIEMQRAFAEEDPRIDPGRIAKPLPLFDIYPDSSGDPSTLTDLQKLLDTASGSECRIRDKH